MNSLNYQVSDKDYIDFYEFNARHTRAGKLAVRTQIMAVPVILFLVLLCTMIFGASVPLIIGQIVLYVIISLIWRKNQYRYLRFSAANLLKKSVKKGDLLYNPQGSITFGEQEITDKRESGTIHTDYPDVAGIYRNQGALYLYMKQGNRIILLPAATFTGETDLETCISFLKQKVAPEKFQEEV